jgi:fluoride exporter
VSHEDRPSSGASGRRTGPAVTAGDVMAVFAGGAAGATARVAFATWFPTSADRYPWTTFAENVVGAFLLGLVLTLLLRGHGAGRRLQLLVGTGALGAFTTYSTFAVELNRLVDAGAGPVAITYAVVSLAAGIGAALCGMLIGRRRRPGDDEVAA